MSSQLRRVLALAGVVTLHAAALLLLVGETRSRLVPAGAKGPPLIVILLSALQPQRATRPGAGRRAPHRVSAPETPAAPATASPEVSTAPRASVDWLSEAKDAAEGQADKNEQHERQLKALTPKSTMFAPPSPKRPGIAWDYAATHRVQPLGGLTTVININDNCGIVLFIIIPFAGGCSVDKTPARGDLFDHMHDPRDEEPLP